MSVKNEAEREEGDFVGNYPCITCSSSDAMSVYVKDESGDRTVDAYCRSGFCTRSNPYISAKELEEEGFDIKTAETKTRYRMNEQVDLTKYHSLPIHGWRERMVTKSVSEKYGVVSEEGRDGQPNARLYPVTKSSEIVGYRKRVFPKDIFAIGNCRANNEMFGQSAFESGQKFLVITTGEEDAMSLAQTLRSEKNGQTYWTPVVSVINGDESIITQIKSNFDYVNSFEKVILMFDMDDAAQKHVDAAARLLSPGKAYIAKLPEKDANDMVRKGMSGELRQAFWKAEPHNRVDILHLEQMWDDFESEDSNQKIPFPPAWSKLNQMMNGGPERGEITIIGALTSIGKTTIINNIAYHLVENTNFKVGALYLEATRREVVRDLLSLEMSLNLRNADRSTLDMPKLKKRFMENLSSKNQFVYADHQGSISNDAIFDKLNYLAKAEDCDVVIVDPIQAAVNSSDNSAMIDFMDSLLKFAKQTDTSVIAVSHMRKPESDNPHDVSEYNLMGSSSINQIAFNTILMSRDKMSDDPVIKGATKIQMVKCRRTGETGEAGWLRYDPKTTHMFTTQDPYNVTEIPEGMEVDSVSDVVVEEDF